jgi:hypothetical protein
LRIVIALGFNKLVPRFGREEHLHQSGPTTSSAGTPFDLPAR